jgi:sporulation protein YlmC with PRC-barrel domain
VRHEMPNKLDHELDGALHLLDRQLLDADGEMLGKVDDVELTQTDEGLTITALLTGPIALLHRLGGRLGDELATKYVQLRPAEPHRSRPWRVPMDRVDRLDSAVHLKVPRDDVLQHDIEALRLGRLTAMDVITADGLDLGSVLDARFRPARGGLVLTELLVGPGRPGSLLGYDRHQDQGPWLIRALVRWTHRHTRRVPISQAQILWNRETVRLTRESDDLGTSSLDR